MPLALSSLGSLGHVLTGFHDGSEESILAGVQNSVFLGVVYYSLRYSLVSLEVTWDLPSLNRIN